MRSFTRGIRNLVRFGPLIWQWRPWDWEFTHDITVACIAGMRQHTAKCRVHEGWENEVQQMDAALDAWGKYLIADTVEEEEAYWNEHWKMYSKLRCWWT